MKPKSINLFLMDGSPRGRIKCTLRNWTGLAYKIPRVSVEESKKRNDLNQSGVYFLIGEENSERSSVYEKPVVYVGQASSRKNGEGIINRLIEHKRDETKQYWNEAVVFTTSDDSFGPTEISYLEHRFVSMVHNVGRYNVKNLNLPSGGNVREEIEAEMEEFIENAVIVMGILGYYMFEPLVDEEEEFEGLTLYLERYINRAGKNIEAKCIRTKEGFVVLEGSIVNKNYSKYISEGSKKRIEQARVVDGMLQEKELFNTPSGAAEFVTGTPINGWVYWKNANGVTLDELERSPKEEDDNTLDIF